MEKITNRAIFLLFALSFTSIAKADITGLITIPGGSDGYSQYNSNFIFEGSPYVVHSTSTGKLQIFTPPQSSVSDYASYCSSATHVGRILLSTNSTSGQWIYVCESSGDWVLQGDGGGSGGGTSVYPATSTILANKGILASTLTLTTLSPGVAHVVAGSSNVVTTLVSLSTEVTGILPLANMSSGATYYIQNTNSLQSGATFYTSSGTLNIFLRVGEVGVRPVLQFDASNASGNPSLNLFNGLTSPGGQLNFKDYKGNNDFGFAGGLSSFSFSLSSGTSDPPPAPLTRFTIARQTGLITFQDQVANTIFHVAPGSSTIYLNKPLLFNDADNSNYVGLKSPATVSSNKIWTLPAVDGSNKQAVLTDGSGNFSIGFASAASNTSANNFPMGDANGSLQPSILSYLVSYPIFTGGIIFSAGNILATGDMGGLSASLVNGSLDAKMSFGVGSGFTSTYRTNVPDDPPGPYQAWVSTGPSGREFQFQNITVIVSTSGLQTGATFYVSSGTVTNVQVSTVNFNDGSKLATSPEKEYWWPAGATFPLEADADSIASVVLSSATKFDFLTTDFDSATDECRSLNFFVSTNTLVSVTTVTLNAYWGSYTATSGNVGWYFYHNNGAQHGEKPDTLTPQSHSSSFDSVNGSTGTYTVTSWDVSVSSLTWRGGDIVDAKVCRDADNGSDTMSGDAKLYGFGMRFKRK